MPEATIMVTIDGKAYTGTTTLTPVASTPSPIPVVSPTPIWEPLKAGRADSTAPRWGWDSIDLSSAGSTVARSTTTPLTLICRTDGRDGQNGRARVIFEPKPWVHARLRTVFGIRLMPGWRNAIAAGGSAQVWKFDCWPTANNSVALLYRQQPDTWSLTVKDAGVDTDITPPFMIPEDVWTTLDLRLLLKSDPSGAAEVYRDGALVSEVRGVKTLYRATASGNPITYIRYGLAAHGPGQMVATRVDLDAATLYGMETVR